MKGIFISMVLKETNWIKLLILAPVEILEINFHQQILLGPIFSLFLLFFVFNRYECISITYTYAFCFWSIPICNIPWIDTSPRGRSVNLIIREAAKDAHWPNLSTIGASNSAVSRRCQRGWTMSHLKYLKKNTNGMWHSCQW